MPISWAGPSESPSRAPLRSPNGPAALHMGRGMRPSQTRNQVDNRQSVGDQYNWYAIPYCLFLFGYSLFAIAHKGIIIDVIGE